MIFPVDEDIMYDSTSDEYFIARSPFMFDIILEYAYTGHLSVPEYVCEQSLVNELKFWRLLHLKGLQCCATVTSTEEKILDDSTQNGDKERVIRRAARGRTGRLLNAIWRFCENPESSKAAMVFNVLSIIFILVSIINLVIGTLPSLQHCDSQMIPRKAVDSLDAELENGTTSSNENERTRTIKKNIADKFSSTCDGGLIFDLIEAVCIAWFTLELIFRFASCPNKLAYIKAPLNIIDFFATFPFYVETAVWAAGAITDLNRVNSVSSLLMVLRVLRVLRVFRILRLARYFDSLQMIGQTLWDSRRDMGLLIVLLAVGVLIFSTILFYVERDVEDSSYTSIPATFWFAIVTLTTTGYGDSVPTTALGQIVAGVACIAGVLILAFPVSILVEHFRLTYAKHRSIWMASQDKGAKDQANERIDKRNSVRRKITLTYNNRDIGENLLSKTRDMTVDNEL